MGGEMVWHFSGQRALSAALTLILCMGFTAPRYSDIYLKHNASLDEKSIGKGRSVLSDSTSNVGRASRREEGSSIPDIQFVRTPEGPLIRGEAGRIFAVMVKLELFSQKCLVRTRAYHQASVQQYASEGWQCIVETPLPENCRDYAYHVLKATGAVRNLPEFLILQKSMPRIIGACVPISAKIVKPIDEEASILDIALADIGKANAATMARVERYRLSDSIHSNVPPYPGYHFPHEMCRKLMTGEEFTQPGFWLLYCGNENYGVRASSAAEIDQLLKERNLHG